MGELDNYLGLPLTMWKNKTIAFRFLIDRFSNRIKSWSKRLLSYGRKEVFSKVVLQALPTHTFSIYLLSKGITEALEARMRTFWWASKHKGKGWAMLHWDKLCMPKGMRGMGFKDLRLFNLAILGRQIWRLINNKDTLCFKVPSSKYFPGGDPLNSKAVDKPSFTWTSLKIAAGALADGFGWQVGNGRDIRIKEVNWGFEGLGGIRLLEKGRRCLGIFLVIFGTRMLPRGIGTRWWRLMGKRLKIGFVIYLCLGRVLLIG